MKAKAGLWVQTQENQQQQEAADQDLQKRKNIYVKEKNQPEKKREDRKPLDWRLPEGSDPVPVEDQQNLSN